MTLRWLGLSEQCRGIIVRYLSVGAMKTLDFNVMTGVAYPALIGIFD